MENEQKPSDLQTPSTNNQPAPTPQPVIQNTTPITPETGKKNSPWVWVISGCLIIILMSMGVFAFLGWWGFNKAKDEIKKQQPSIEQFKGELESVTKEAQEWEEAAKEIQDSMPNPEDLNYPMPEADEAPVLE